MAMCLLLLRDHDNCNDLSKHVIRNYDQQNSFQLGLDSVNPDIPALTLSDPQYQVEHWYQE